MELNRPMVLDLQGPPRPEDMQTTILLFRLSVVWNYRERVLVKKKLRLQAGKKVQEF